MTYLVHGATGAQGSPVLAALKAADLHVVAVARDVAQVSGPAVAADYGSVDSLTDVYDGVDGVFVHLPLGTPETQATYAETIGTALRRARPRRVVFSTSGYPVDRTGAARGGAGVMIRHLTESGLLWATVEPRTYLENLLLPVTVAPIREEGVLRYPIRGDYAVSWSSHLDVADVVVRLLTDESVSGIVSVGTLPGLVGEQLAGGFGRHFGRAVHFESITPRQYGDLITPLFGPDAANPVVASYEDRLARPHELIPEERSAQRLLGLEPRTVQQWLSEVDV